MIRVVIADDHHLVRQGIRALLDKASDIEVVGEAADGQDALEIVTRLVPDVVVMDISMPRLSGPQVIERLRSLQASTRVLILSMYSDEAVVRQVLRSGAKGYLLKNALPDELLQAIHATYRGATYLSPAISEALMTELATPRFEGDEISAFDRLSLREREVLQLIAEGNTNNTIGQLMNVSVKTVEKHRANIMSKLKVHDVAGLVLIALRHGLIFLDKWSIAQFDRRALVRFDISESLATAISRKRGVRVSFTLSSMVNSPAAFGRKILLALGDRLVTIRDIVQTLSVGNIHNNPTVHQSLASLIDTGQVERLAEISPTINLERFVASLIVVCLVLTQFNVAAPWPTSPFFEAAIRVSQVPSLFQENLRSDERQVTVTDDACHRYKVLRLE